MCKECIGDMWHLVNDFVVQMNYGKDNAGLNAMQCSNIKQFISDVMFGRVSVRERRSTFSALGQKSSEIRGGQHGLG